MAEEITTPETPAQTPAGETPATISPEEIAKLQAALKEANKEAKERRLKLEALEKAEADRKAAEMTEAEKLKAQLEESKSKLAQLERRDMLRRIADKVGLSPALAERLQGNTEEELEADAAKLLELMPANKKPIQPGQPTNPGNAQRVETREEKKARLMGNQPVIFERGGGVNPPQ